MLAAPLLLAALLAPPAGPPLASPAPHDVDGATPERPKWRSLFDGKSLEGWTVTRFGGEGEVYVEDGALYLPFGNNLTGVTVTDAVAKTLPKVDYVIELEARRVTGTDFFCGLTVPMWSPKDEKNSHATLILGGWGGGLIGLSSIDRFDASENPTTTFHRFEDGAWYKVRLEVTKSGVRATLGEQAEGGTTGDGNAEADKTPVEKTLFATDIRKRSISTRSETNLSKPLGIASFATTAAIRGVRIRKLTDAEVKAVDAACTTFQATGGAPPVNEFGEKN